MLPYDLYVGGGERKSLLTYAYGQSCCSHRAKQEDDGTFPWQGKA